MITVLVMTLCSSRVPSKKSWNCSANYRADLCLSAVSCKMISNGLDLLGLIMAQNFSFCIRPFSNQQNIFHFRTSQISPILSIGNYIVNPLLEVNCVLFQSQTSLDLYQRYIKEYDFQSKNLFRGWQRVPLGPQKHKEKL